MRVAVVGAGVVGLAVTHALAVAGHDVHCFEAAEPMAARSTGGTRIFRLAHAVPTLVHLADDARAGWARWSDAAGEPLVGAQGTVVSGDIEGFQAAMTAVGAMHRVDDRIPGLPTTVAAGPFLLDPAGGVIQAERTGQFLISAVKRHIVRAAVTHLDIDGSVARLATPDGTLTAGAVVLAAGAGTPALAGQVGIDVPATLIHHARFSYPLRDPGTKPPCWIDRSQSWRPEFGTYAHLAAPGRWAVGGYFPDADVAWKRGREAVAAMSRDVVTQYVAECVSGVIPEPDEVVYCDATQGLDDGITTARSGPVLTAWGDNLFKFAPVLVRCWRVPRLREDYLLSWMSYSCERREIARRRAEPGWRAAVLDERAQRVRKAAATKRQPQRAKRAMSGGASGGVLSSANDDEVGGLHARLREQLTIKRAA